MNIIKSQNLICFIDPGTWDLTAHNPAKNTVIHHMTPLANIRYETLKIDNACDLEICSVKRTTRCHHDCGQAVHIIPEKAENI